MADGDQPAAWRGRDSRCGAAAAWAVPAMRSAGREISYMRGQAWSVSTTTHTNSCIVAAWNGLDFVDDSSSYRCPPPEVYGVQPFLVPLVAWARYEYKYRPSPRAICPSAHPDDAPPLPSPTPTRCPSPGLTGSEPRPLQLRAASPAVEWWLGWRRQKNLSPVQSQTHPLEALPG